VDIQGIAVLAHTFGHTQIGGMGSILLRTFEVEINIHLQIFLLLGGGFDLNVALMRGRYNFLADFTIDLPAAGMSFE
jgi:hypothetical protein